MTIDLRDDGTTGRSGRTVTSRVLSVLDAFTDQRRSLTLSEIGRRAGIPIATAHRLVGELVAWGALERDPGGRYQIGLRLWEVGTLAPRGLGLRDVAMPFLEDLWAATQHHVQLAVLEGTDVVYLERLGGRDDAATVRGRVGGRWPAHTTGAGLVLLAFAGEPVQRRYLSQPLATFTPLTIADGRLLRGTLSGVRQKGFAVSDRQVTTDASRWPRRSATATARWSRRWRSSSPRRSGTRWGWRPRSSPRAARSRAGSAGCARAVSPSARGRAARPAARAALPSSAWVS